MAYPVKGPDNRPSFFTTLLNLIAGWFAVKKPARIQYDVDEATEAVIFRRLFENASAETKQMRLELAREFMESVLSWPLAVCRGEPEKGATFKSHIAVSACPFPAMGHVDHLLRLARNVGANHVYNFREVETSAGTVMIGSAYLVPYE